jgi:phosphoserine phosphatase
MLDPLPSWRSGDTKQHIVDFIEAATTPTTADFVPALERVATFDLDGTLWTEQPMYCQAEFTIDLFIKRHGGSRSSEPLAALLEKVRSGITDLHQVFATLASFIRARIRVEEYIAEVQAWLATAKHPCFERSYLELTYQPMRELLRYLENNEFRTYLVSGTGIEFARAFSFNAFGIPPERVIGTSLETEFSADPDGSNATINLLPWPDFIDNGKRKAESINEFIGRRPLAAFGNADGDHQMLEWTAAGAGPRLMMIVHHTDGAREYGYGSDARIGHLQIALDEANRRGWDTAKKRGWLVADMARDWGSIYSFGDVVRNRSSRCRAK